MGIFDSTSKTTANDLADNSNASAANDLIDIGQVSGAKNRQEVDLSHKNTEGGDLVNLGSVQAKNATQNIDSSRVDSSVRDSHDSTIEDSYNSTIEDSYNSDFSGYSGNSGTINILDGGVIDAMQKTVDAFSSQTTKQLQTTQALAKSVSSGGQTVVAETSAKMVKYLAYGVGTVVLIVGLVFVASEYKGKV